jgi:hypothetical protein
MSLPKRDVLATVLVAAAGVLYWLWAAGSAPPGLGSVRATGIVILALGFVASASAVVPSFDQLMHGNKAYVAVTSIIGLVAFAGGLQMLIADSETGLGVVMIAMVVLWAIATVHHVMLARPAPAGRALRTGPPTAAAH